MGVDLVDDQALLAVVALLDRFQQRGVEARVLRVRPETF
jgi:anti-anti-sigma regulatory factor